MSLDFPTVPNRVLSRWDRRQRNLLYIAAVYDGGFGVPVFLFPTWVVGVFGLPLADSTEIWLRLDGIFLVVMALIYLVTARDPSRYLGNVLVAIWGKIVSIVFYVAYFIFLAQTTELPNTPKKHYFLLVLAAADVIMAALHVWFIGPDKRAKIRDALRPARAVD